MTTITKDQIHLIDGEISVTDKMIQPKHGELYVTGATRQLDTFDDAIGSVEYLKEQGVGKVTHSTASLEGVTKLDRSVFVKPKDVVKAYNESKKEFGNAPVLGFQSFKTGYNANKGEFTDMEAFYIFNAACAYNEDIQLDADTLVKNRVKFYNELVAKLRPLSIPESIEIHNNEVKVNWE